MSWVDGTFGLDFLLAILCHLDVSFLREDTLFGRDAPVPTGTRVRTAAKPWGRHCSCCWMAA